MRIVVVGGGIVGIAAAHRLAAEGHEVVLVEAGAPGAGASHGNAAKIALAESGPVPAPGVLMQGLKWMLRPDSPLSVRPSLDPSYLRFMLRMARHCTASAFERGLRVNLALAESANELLDDYRSGGADFEMHDRGVLLAFETEERYRESLAHLEVFADHGVRGERLVGDAVREREPALADSIRFGLFFPGDRQLRPDALSAALAAQAQTGGVEILRDTRVVSFARGGVGVSGVLTSAGRLLPADAIVLAAGAWTRDLARLLRVDLPIHPGKGYSIDHAPSPVPLRTSLTLEDARVAVTPLDGMTRLAGTMEFGTMSTAVDPVRVDAIRRAAVDGLRGWEERAAATEQAPWAGLRPMTPDGLPVVGRLSAAPNVLVASGHGMLGLTLAPGTARLVADQIAGRTPDLAPEVLEAIAPQRFDARRLRHRP